MFCNKCGREIREGSDFCTGCGARAKAASLPQRPIRETATKTEVTKAAVPFAGRKPKKKTPLLVGTLLALLVLGAGIWFFFLRSRAVNLNDYIVMSYEDYSSGKEARAGFDVVRLIKDNPGAFQLNDGSRQKVRKYTQEKYTYLMMDSLVDAAAQAQTGLLGAVSGQELSQDEGLASLALVAAVADNSSPGGNLGTYGTLFPQIKNGSKFDKTEGLKDGDTVRFSWGEVDKATVERLFKLTLNYSDVSFTVGEGKHSEAASPADTGGQAENGTAPSAADKPSETGAVAEASTSADESSTSLTNPQAQTSASAATQAPSPAPLAIGDVIRLGSMDQDNNPSNGTEEIDWIIYRIDGENVFLISQVSLFAHAHYERPVEITYETSRIRAYLNNGFVKQAFTAAERALLKPCFVSADKNPNYPGVSPGRSFSDKVFILSVSEINEFFPTPSSRLCRTSRTAEAGGVFVAENGFSPWWTRTPGSDNTKMTLARSDGSFNMEGRLVDVDAFGVRPAICLSLSDAQFYKLGR